MNKPIVVITLVLMLIVEFTFYLVPNTAKASENGDSNSMCTFINGEYKSLGKSSYDKTPYLERNIFHIEGYEDKSNTVTLKVLENSSKLLVSLISGSGKSIIEKETGTLFECQNDKIVFEGTSKGSGDGSSVQLTTTRSEFSLDGSNTLVINVSIYTERRSWLFFRDKETYTIKYSFTKL